MRICFVVPVYNEAPTLAALAAAIAEHAAPWPHRILFIDDGSTDGTAEALRALRAAQPTVDFLRLHRNMGKTRALAAGFARAEGDVFVTMDGDLQDRPEEIPRLLAKYEEGYDFVCGWKADRQDPGHKVALSHIYNRGLCRMFGIELHDVNTGFKAIRADLARRLPLFGDMHRMMAVFAARAGYRVAEVPVAHAPRAHGASKYGLRRYHKGAIDACVAWMLLQNTDTAAVRGIMIGTAVAALVLAAALLAASHLFAASVPAVLCLLLGGAASFAAGALAALARGLLPLGEWLRRVLDPGGVVRDIAEEAIG